MPAVPAALEEEMLPPTIGAFLETHTRLIDGSDLVPLVFCLMFPFEPTPGWGCGEAQQFAQLLGMIRSWEEAALARRN